MVSLRIYRDEWGMPHIHADSEEEAFFGVGYAQAEDRLETIFRHQLMVEGRAAEALGREALSVDVMARLWMHAEESAAAFARLPEQLRRNYRAFTAGIQAYAGEHPERVPAWAPQVQPWLPYAVTRTFLWPPYAIGDAVRACLRAGIEPDEELVGSLHRQVTPASNEWVLLPWRTDAGACILLSDPHGDIAGVQMFEYAFEAGALKFSGVTLVGCALPLLGFTTRVAWAYTTGGPQVSDCYRIPVDPSQPRNYRVDGEQRQMRVREALIEVADGDPQPRVFEYVELNGVLSPVVARADAHAFALCTPYMHDPALLDEQHYRWLAARDVNDFRAAMEPCAQFAQNVMAADTSGNALYVRAGRVPVRAAGVDARLPVDGSTSATAWQGIHALADLVQVENPASGYMQNCNIGPDTMTLGPLPDRLQPERYPDYLYNDLPGRSNTRGDRARELLASCLNATVDDALAIALDVRWPRVEMWQAALRGAAERHASLLRDCPNATRRIIHRLLAFDGEARGDSVGALDYVYWRTAVGWPADDAAEAARSLIDAVDAGRDLEPEQQRALLAAASRAAERIRERHGRDEVAYGDEYRLGTAEESWPARGGAIWTHEPRLDWNLDEFTKCMLAPLRVFHEFTEPDEHRRRYAVSGGRSLRLTILTEPPVSYSVVLWGQSEAPGSPHLFDQAQLASESRVRRIHLSLDELRPHVVSERALEAPHQGPSGGSTAF